MRDRLVERGTLAVRAESFGRVDRFGIEAATPWSRMMNDDRSQAIAARAYELWERAGRPRGQHEQHWRQAEEEIGGATLSGSAAERKAATEAPELQKAAGKPPETAATTKPF